jgi:hypothetical protein
MHKQQSHSLQPKQNNYGRNTNRILKNKQPV